MHHLIPFNGMSEREKEEVAVENTREREQETGYLIIEFTPTSGADL